MHRQKEDGPDILKDENAKGDPPRQGRKFKLVIKKFDHNHRAGGRKGHGHIQGVETALPEGKPEAQRESHAKQHANHNLQYPTYDKSPTRGHQLLQVDFQTNDEKEKDEAYLGNGADGVLVLYPAKTHFRPKHDTGGQIGQQKRLAQGLGQQAESRRRDNGQSDVGQEICLVHGPSSFALTSGIASQVHYASRHVGQAYLILAPSSTSNESDLQYALAKRHTATSCRNFTHQPLYCTHHAVRTVTTRQERP